MPREYVAIVGSREWGAAEDAVRQAVEDFVRALALHAPNTVVVSGGADGVDSWAEDEAYRQGLEVLVFRPDWAKHGPAAGFHRNRDIVEWADRVVAFWDGESRGTGMTINLTVVEQKPIRVVYPGEVPVL